MKQTTKAKNLECVTVTVTSPNGTVYKYCINCRIAFRINPVEALLMGMGQ